MRGVVLFCVLVAAAASARTPRRKSYSGYKLIEVTPKNDDQLEALRQLEGHRGIDFWTPARMSRPTSILVSPAMYKETTDDLESLGLMVTIKNEDIQVAMNIEHHRNEMARSNRRKRSMMSIVNTFPRFDEVNTWLGQMASSNSHIAQVTDIGLTYEGRQMKVLKIGKPSANGYTKPALWLDAGIHAREWLTVATMVHIIERLVNDYSTSTEVKQLVDTFDWYILPVANPDGYEHTHTSDRLWRKTRSPQSSGWWTCTGADPNRNFDFHWRESGTSTDPCSDTYGGPNPFSEKCTQNIRDFVLEKKQNLKLFFSLHSYSQLWLTPWAYGNSEQPSDIVELERVATIGAQALKSVNGRDFEIGNPPTILYAASGGSYDWAKGVAGVKYSYVLELFPSGGSSNGFVVDDSEIPKSGKEIWAATKAVVNALRI